MNYEHQIETSCFPAAFTHFSPNKDFQQSTNSLAAQESKNIILAQVKNMFLLQLSSYLLTLNPIPRFSTKALSLHLCNVSCYLGFVFKYP